MHLVLAVILCSACSDDPKESLQTWMAEASKNLQGNIPPLPQITPYEAAIYDKKDIVDPFRSSRIHIEQKSSGQFQPDLSRPREPLELHSLESLKYVGSLKHQKQTVGVVLADGALYQVKLGSRLGQDFGIVVKITDTEISLRESVQDATGDWIERNSTLILQAKEGK